jgi:hypothetical protein
MTYRLAGVADPVASLGQCGAAGCFGVVWLPPGEYDFKRDHLSWSALARGYIRVPSEEAA